MIISEDFTYNRKYHVKDLYDKKNIFKQINSLEFETFDIFVNKFLEDLSWANLPLERIIIPIENRDQLEFLSKLFLTKLPHIFLYIKNVSKVLKDFDFNLPHTSLLLDSSEVPVFKKFILETQNKNLIQYLSRTLGFFRVKITAEDVNSLSIAEKYFEPYILFPYFSVCEAYWDFYSFRDLKLKDLNSIIYNLKYIKYNVINSHKNETVTWADFYKNHEDNLDKAYSQYKLEISNYPPYKSLIFSGKGLKLDRYSEKEFISYEELQSLDFTKLNELIGIFSMKFKDTCDSYISYYQNYKDNNTWGQLPYLNRMLNEIFLKGEI